VIDDTDATITYSPEWRQRPESQDGYYNVSAHDTNIPGAGFALPCVSPSFHQEVFAVSYRLPGK
jgi:hypothetical protein